MGRDVVFAEHDRFAVLRYYCAQVKLGDVGVSDRQISSLVDQLKLAYQTRYDEPTTGRTHVMSGVYLIVTGTISDQAKRYLKEQTGQWLHVLDGDALDTARHAAPNRMSDRECSGRIALLSVDLNERIGPIARSIIDINTSGTDIRLNPSVAPIRSLDRFLDIAITELDPTDIACLIALHSTLLALNGMYLKVPVGSFPQSMLPTINTYKQVAQQVIDLASRCSQVLDHVLQHPRPEPGKTLPPSGVGAAQVKDDAS